MSSNPSRPIRRVVTGETADGASIVASDAEEPPIEVPLMPGAQFFSLWGSDAAPVLPNDGAAPDFTQWFPPETGFRFQVIVLPPDGTALKEKMSAAAAVVETQKRLPGLLAAMDPKNPGMHATDTIDLIYVASGACEMELADGSKTALSAGDAIVQNGARHAWRNPHEGPCTLINVSLGAARKSDPA
ncbi:cupin domain-containing protein [Methyloligella sp. 2.7D]|uniref:cupin domain-containing protein n=1 Tax=unclassified Methyloligella TaxID=2625955 RepID=UPI00157CA5A2|nr:cupin domain-containing protein [Methyloligella sp. GL2]QKP77269.1 cupin domain-containing protein [Methyloligella sp. GL2]